jgi:iron complex transport system substrate-binding protein
MKKRFHLVAIGAVILVATIAWQKMQRANALGKGRRDTKVLGHSDGGGTHQRIVSLAPSITESLFSLGLGERIVGVTQYCDYPKEALSKKKVGGYYDPNYEAIVGLRPDLVVLFPEHLAQRQALADMDIETLTLNHNKIENILESILLTGKTCGVGKKAQSLVADIRQRIAKIQDMTKGLPRPRVLVSMGRNMGTGSIQDAYISGGNDYYHELITMAGGKNAYQGDIAFPAVSKEGIIRMNPEVIIDMIPDIDTTGWNEKAILDEWQSVKEVSAVQSGRVYVFTEDYVVVPGPRFILLLEKIAKVLHPELGSVSKVRTEP